MPVVLSTSRTFEYQDRQPALAILRGIDSASFRDRYGPADGMFPRRLSITHSRIAADAHVALRGIALTPVINGETTADTRRGKIRLDYEVYSNTYQCFVLLMPRRRLTSGTFVQAHWN